MDPEAAGHVKRGSATAAGLLVAIGVAVVGILVALIAWPPGHSPTVGEWLIQAALLIGVVVIVAGRVRSKG